MKTNYNIKNLYKNLEKTVQDSGLVNAVKVATFNKNADYNAKGAETGLFIIVGELASTVYVVGATFNKFL